VCAQVGPINYSKCMLQSKVSTSSNIALFIEEKKMI